MSVRWKWGGCTNESERENDREHSFKPWKVEVDWLKEGRQEDDWTRGSDAENKKQPNTLESRLMSRSSILKFHVRLSIIV